MAVLNGTDAVIEAFGAAAEEKEKGDKRISFFDCIKSINACLKMPTVE